MKRTISLFYKCGEELNSGVPRQISFSNVCRAPRISLLWVPNELNEILEMRFEFTRLQSDWQMDIFTFNTSTLARTQIFLLGTRTRFSAQTDLTKKRFIWVSMY